MRKRKKQRRDVREKDLTTKKPKRQKPLKFLLGVMNDENMEYAERIKCALAALPYVHAQKTRKVGKAAKSEEPKAGEGVPASKPKKLGKKETKQVEAKLAASSGRFRPLSPPNAVRVNGSTH
jgi:hypothetical protein